jgi:uncharacterized protein (DUF1015 family)
VADVRPLTGIRYSPDADLASAVCPPFDTISPAEQARLYEASPVNAVRLELPRANGDPYTAAADTLSVWLAGRTLVRDERPALYLYRQQFTHGGASHSRLVLFARLRLEPWETGAVLPHEHTFNAPKEDRMNVLRSLRLNTSPVFLFYPDAGGQLFALLERLTDAEPTTAFEGADGLPQRLWRIDDPGLVSTLSGGLSAETLYIADGHHRYETALAFGRDCGGPEDAPERFALVALVAADDPGLLVLPTHRLVCGGPPVDEALDALSGAFEIEIRPSQPDLLRQMEERGRMTSAFGLLAAGSPELYLLTMLDPQAADRHLPAERPPVWRKLDTAICDHVILRHALRLDEAAMHDYDTLWFEEDAPSALAEVREGAADYAVLLNAIPPRRIVAVADAGERMPQKSTYFYPKIPTGLVFNPLFD